MGIINSYLLSFMSSIGSRNGYSFPYLLLKPELFIHILFVLLLEGGTICFYHL